MNKRGIIYKISSPMTNSVYIGSTRKSVSKQFAEHICAARSSKYMSHIIISPDPVAVTLATYDYIESRELLLEETLYIAAQPMAVNKTILLKLTLI